MIFAKRLAGQAIRYDVSFSLYKLGNYIMSGCRRPVPSHEADVSRDGNPWGPVLRLGSKGFHFLTGICGTDSLSYNGTN